MNASAQKGQFLPPLLREAYPTHTAKRAARAAGVPHERARGWLKGRGEPSLGFLLDWAARCDALAAALETRLHDRRAARLDGLAAAGAGAAAAPGRRPLSE